MAQRKEFEMTERIETEFRDMLFQAVLRIQGGGDVMWIIGGGTPSAFRRLPVGLKKALRSSAK